MEITELTRHTIVDGLLMRPASFNGSMELIDFLKRVWNLASMRSTDHRFKSAEGDIWQHTIRNDDWEYTPLLQKSGGFLCSRMEGVKDSHEFLFDSFVRADRDGQASLRRGQTPCP